MAAVAHLPIDFGLGKRIDVFLRAGEISAGLVLTADAWVLGTIANVRPDENKVLVHVTGGVAKWHLMNSTELAPPGQYTGVVNGIQQCRSYVSFGTADDHDNADAKLEAATCQDIDVGGKRKRPAP